jgi:hypothetical protein
MRNRMQHSKVKIWGYHSGGYDEFCLLGYNLLHDLVSQKTKQFINKYLSHWRSSSTGLCHKLVLASKSILDCESRGILITLGVMQCWVKQVSTVPLLGETKRYITVFRGPPLIPSQLKPIRLVFPAMSLPISIWAALPTFPSNIL